MKTKDAVDSYIKHYKQYQETSKMRMIEILNKWYAGWDNMDEGLLDAKIFAEILVDGNPYTPIPNITPWTKRAPSVEVVDIPDNDERFEEAAFYEPTTNVIYVSRNYMMRFVKHEVSLAEFINTISHENRHYIQEQALNSLNYSLRDADGNETRLPSLPDEECKILMDLKNNNSILDERNVATILSVVKSFLGEDEFTKRFDGKTEEEKTSIAKEFAFANYVQSKHEEDARVGAIAFTRGMLQCLIAEPLFGKFERRAFSQELEKELPILEQEEKLTKERHYKLFEEFDKELNKLSLEQLKKIEDISKGLLYTFESNFFETSLGNYDSYFDEFEYGRDSGAVHTIIDETLKKIVVQTYKNKSSEEMIQDFLLSSSSGHVLVADAIGGLIFEKMKYEHKKSKDFVQNLCDYYQVANLTDASFYVSAISMFSEKQFNELTDSYIKQGKYEYISLLLSYNNSFFVDKVKGVPFGTYHEIVEAEMSLAQLHTAKKLTKMFYKGVAKKNLSDRELFELSQIGAAIESLKYSISSVDFRWVLTEKYIKNEDKFKKALEEVYSKASPRWAEYQMEIYGETYVESCNQRRQQKREAAAFWREEHERDKTKTAVVKI